MLRVVIHRRRVEGRIPVEKTMLRYLLCCTLPLLSACASTATTPCAEPGPTVASGVAEPEEPVAAAKYVFLFIGDGMGLNQVYSAQLFKNVLDDAPLDEGVAELSFTRFPAQGTATTYCDGSTITDSAAAGTALATGHKTAPGVLGLRPDLKTPVESIGYLAKEQGMRVGILSSVSLDHATPAAFYAHEPSRNNYYAIASELPLSGFDYFGGGGFKQPEPTEGTEGESLWAILEAHGYAVARNGRVSDPVQLPAVVLNETLDDNAAMPYVIDRAPGDPGLADHTRRAVELLDSDDGFVMMVEGGKIDWACHANDATSAIYETLEFAASVDVAVEFLRRHPRQTTIVVTADHETGGMGLGYSGTGYRTYLEKLLHQKMSFRKFQAILQDYLVERPEAALEELSPLIRQSWGLSVARDAREQRRVDAVPGPGYAHAENVDRPGLVLTSDELSELRAALAVTRQRLDKHERNRTLQLAYGEHDPFTVTLSRLLARRAGVYFTTFYHTAAPVPVFAAGVGHERFDTQLDNTEIARHLMDLLAAAD